MIAPIDKSQITLRAFFREVYQPLRMLDASPGSAQQIETSINRLSAFLGRPATLADLTERTICNWMADGINRGKSPVTINGQAKRLVTLWRFAKRRKFSVPDDLDGIEYLKQPRRLPTAWSIPELVRLIESCRATEGMIDGVPAAKFWPALIFLIFDTGIRRSAVLAIQFDELDLAAKLLRVPAERMKNQVEQYFKLSDQTIAAILETLPPARKLVFPWRFGMRYLGKRLRKILDRAGLPSGRRDLLHKLRRTCASHLAAVAGESIAFKQLGHQDASCIRRYVDPRFTNKHDSAKLLPRPGWNGQLIEVEESTLPAAPELAPAIVRLSRADLEGDALAPLRARRGFTGPELRAALECLGVYRKAFAEALGIDRRTLYDMLNGHKKIGVRVRKRIRAALGLTFTRRPKVKGGAA
jgi:integrase